MQLSFRRKKKPETRPELGWWLRELKREAIDGDQRDIVVDLSQVEQISSNELGELAKIHLKLRHSDRRLVLENVQELVFQVFELTRMNRLIDVRNAHIV